LCLKNWFQIRQRVSLKYFPIMVRPAEVDNTWMKEKSATYGMERGKRKLRQMWNRRRDIDRSHLLWGCSQHLGRLYSFFRDLEVFSSFHFCRLITEYGWEVLNVKHSYASHRQKANKFEARITRMIVSVFTSPYAKLVIFWKRCKNWKTSSRVLDVSQRLAG